MQVFLILLSVAVDLDLSATTTLISFGFYLVYVVRFCRDC